MVLEGDPTDEECSDKWEEILKLNGEANGNFSFSSYLTGTQTYGMLMSDYVVIKAMLMKLSLVVDQSSIDFLKRKGYKINTENSQKYAESLSAAMRRSDNIITKMNMKRNEFLGVDGPRKKTGFNEALANISFAMGFSIPDTVTLSQYNEYSRIAREKAKASRRGRDK